MTVQDLIKELNHYIDHNFLKPTDKVYFRQLDTNGKLNHEVEYFLIKEDSVIFCEE